VYLTTEQGTGVQAVLAAGRQFTTDESSEETLGFSRPEQLANAGYTLNKMPNPVEAATALGRRFIERELALLPKLERIGLEPLGHPNACG